MCRMCASVLREPAPSSWPLNAAEGCAPAAASRGASTFFETNQYSTAGAYGAPAAAYGKVAPSAAPAYSPPPQPGLGLGASGYGQSSTPTYAAAPAAYSGAAAAAGGGYGPSYGSAFSSSYGAAAAPPPPPPPPPQQVLGCLPQCPLLQDYAVSTNICPAVLQQCILHSSLSW